MQDKFNYFHRNAVLHVNKMGLVSALYELQIISYPSISKFFNKVLDNANGSSFFYIANGSSHKKSLLRIDA